MVNTNIVVLDEMLGSIPGGSTVLFLTEPTVEGDPFVYQAFYENISAGKEGVIVALSKPPQYLLREFEEYGWSLERYRSRVVFVDCYSMLIGAPSDAEFIVKHPNDIKEIIETIEKALDSVEGGILAIPALSTLVDYCGEQSFVENLEKLKETFKKATTTFLSFILWPYDEKTIEKIRDVDCLINIKGIEQRVVFGEYFEVAKARWLENIENRSVMFKVIKPGGVRVYIPKIIVTGPFHSGKSTFIHTLSTRAVSVDRLGTTIALDHGHVEHAGVSADIFGTPGQERFDPLLRTLSLNAIGTIVMVDSARPETFDRSKAMWQEVWKTGMPIIFLANKQDEPGALPPEEIKERMRLPEEIPILPCVAKDKEHVLKAFETLVDLILHRKEEEK
ncbi:MAG: ATPase domain-containing protein [Candidatus Thermoplasmatota archaeon]|nr:ATPase domain-containing protein [Candidatus Thermoplasmatota archaeon]